MILVEFADKQLVEVSPDEIYGLICAGNVSALQVNGGWLEIPRSVERRDDGSASTNGVCTWPHDLLPTIQLQEQIADLKRQLKEKESVIAELGQAIAESKRLEGLITICANCKKIKDEEEQWVSPEKYIQERTGSKFSHGICRDCVSKLYPDAFSI